jgi:hypothetical protein
MVLLGVLSALLIVGLLAGGTWMWWLTGRGLPRSRYPSGHGRDAQAALRRHPAGRERWVEPDGLRALGQPDDMPGPGQPTGPDDDPEFISALERLIRGEDPGGPDGPA